MIKFIYIEYDSNDPDTADKQARQFLDEALRLHVEEGYQRIGITYSANQQQTERIKEIYSQKKYETGTDGANQAAVMCRLEYHLRHNKLYERLRYVVRIIGITTIDYRNSDNVAKYEDVQASLEDATRFIEAGGYLLGWQNQDTAEGSLAIGGGVAAKIQPDNQKKLIQNWIRKTFSKKNLITKVVMDEKKTVEMEPVIQRSQMKVNDEAQKKTQTAVAAFNEFPSVPSALRRHSESLKTSETRVDNELVTLDKNKIEMHWNQFEARVKQQEISSHFSPMIKQELLNNCMLFKQNMDAFFHQSVPWANNVTPFKNIMKYLEDIKKILTDILPEGEKITSEQPKPKRGLRQLLESFLQLINHILSWIKKWINGSANADSTKSSFFNSSAPASKTKEIIVEAAKELSALQQEFSVLIENNDDPVQQTNLIKSK